MEPGSTMDAACMVRSTIEKFDAQPAVLDEETRSRPEKPVACANVRERARDRVWCAIARTFSEWARDAPQIVSARKGHTTSNS
jgi:hypothetical protein